MKQLFKTIFPAFLLLFLCSTGKAQKEFELRGTTHWIKFSDAPNSFYHYLASQAFSYLDKRSDKIAELHSLSDWQQRQREVRRILTETVGAFPSKTPLNAKVTKSINKDGYKVENIIYESQPGYYVTSALFIPDVIKDGKAPAIIYCSGHSNTGYRSYQKIIINLVKKAETLKNSVVKSGY